MANEEKGILDELIEGICRDIELKGIVEASRDENGKVDEWKATGIAMGLGHTSDTDMAHLAGFLGAEGAFDDDSSGRIGRKHSYSDGSYSLEGGKDIHITERKSVDADLDLLTSITREEYEKIDDSIRQEEGLSIGILIFLLLFVAIIFIYGISKGLHSAIFFIFTIVPFIIMFLCLLTETAVRKERLAKLENKYNELNSKKDEAVEDTADLPEEKKEEPPIVFDDISEKGESEDKPQFTSVEIITEEADKSNAVCEMKVSERDKEYHQSHTSYDNSDDDENEYEDEFCDTYIGNNLIYAEDMKLLNEAGYEEFELDLLEPDELKEAMEDAGVDTFFYTFD